MKRFLNVMGFSQLALCTTASGIALIYDDLSPYGFWLPIASLAIAALFFIASGVRK